MANKRRRSDGRLLHGGLPGKVGACKGSGRTLGPLPRRLPSSTPSGQQTKLLARLKTAEETLRAIHSGEVDALMVSGRRGEQVVSLKGGEPAYRMLVEAMSEGAATLSRNGAVLYCNRRFAGLMSRPQEKMIGMAVQSLIAKTERDRFEALLAKAQKTVAKGEFSLRCRDGSLVPVNLSLNRFRGYKGHALGMVITDLSEQKRRHVEETRLQLAAIVESSQDAIIGKNLDAKIVSWNPGAEAIYGYTAKEAIGQPISILSPPERANEWPAIMERIRRGQKVEHYETKRRRKDGTVIDVSLAVSPIKTAEGETVGASAVSRDITELKQATEVKQAQAMRQLLLERVLSAQEEERRRIARELHDEAGQLLTSLLVGLRTLEHARNLADVKGQGHRLREIAAQTIDEVGRLARGLHPTVLDDHGLGVALNRYISEYMKAHNIAVDLKFNEADSSSLSSAVQIGLYRIVQEALTNAAKHSGAKAVSIKLTRLTAALEVAIADDGCGFDAKAVAVSSHRLGIQSMRERAAMLGGTVSFGSQRKGTKILVRVPLAEQDFAPPVERRST
jgi:PAS domain S-box-containing protein